MKILKPINITVKSDLDADDYGQRLCQCIREMDPNQHVVNLIKVYISDKADLKAEQLYPLMKDLHKNFSEMLGDTNFMILPIIPGVVEDITVDYIEVINNESN